MSDLRSNPPRSCASAQGFAETILECDPGLTCGRLKIGWRAQPVPIVSMSDLRSNPPRSRASAQGFGETILECDPGLTRSLPLLGSDVESLHLFCCFTETLATRF